MFDIKQINLSDLPAIPVGVRKALTTRSVDVGSAYLAFSLTILIMFITYYAITLLHELYRTIVSTTFLRSTKHVLPPSALARVCESSSEVTPMPSLEGPVSDEETTTGVSFQSQSHDITQGSTPNPQRDVAAMEDTAEGFAEEFEAQARVKETHVVAEDIVEPAPAPLVQDAASETDAAERDTGALAVPHITSTADIYDGPGECEDGLRNAGNVSAPTASLNHEDHTADTLFGTSSSALLLPALPSVDRLESCDDDSLQPSAALVTGLSTFSRCADLPDSPVSAESDGGCPAIEGLSSESDGLTEDTHPLHASGTGPLPPPAPIDISCEETTIEDHAARFFQYSAGTLEDLSSPPAEETVGESEDNGVVAVEGGSTKADIMQSAVLISGADAAEEQDTSESDSDRDFEWTTVDREDFGTEAEQEPVSKPRSVQEETSYAAEVSQGDVLSHGIDASVDLSTPSECAQVDVASPFPVVPSITIEEAPVVTAAPLMAIPSIEATGATALSLLGAASSQGSEVAHVANVAQPADGYIGPLSHKPTHARVHSLEKPDWAVAPETPKSRTEAPQPKRDGSKPRADGNKPRHWHRKRPQNANGRGGQADGDTRKAPAPRQTPRTSGKDEKTKTVPCRAPAAQKPKASPAPTKTQAESDARGETRRRSARLAQE